MPNKLLTPTQILRESLRVLHNNLVFIKGINRGYDSQFAQTGAKIGSTINLRLPNRYYVRRGPTMAVQNTNEQTVPLSLTTQYGVDVNFTTAELTLSLDDFGQRILTPAMAKIASEMDMDALNLAFDIYNTVGNPGTMPGTAGGIAGTLTDSSSPRVFLNAGMVLTNFSVPRDNSRRIVYTPDANANTVASLTGLFEDRDLLAAQYRKGTMGVALGFEFAEDQNVNILTAGAHGGAPVIAFAGQSGATLVLSGCTPSVNNWARRGEVFTITGVNSVNPENQQNLQQLARFVVLADASSDAAGNITLSISPSIKAIGAGVADGTVTVLPPFNAACTFIFTAATAYKQNLAYHQDAFAMGSADLMMPNGVDFSARETYDGISMRILRQYDINNDQLPCRIDVLAGFKTIRPEMACRITQ